MPPKYGSVAKAYIVQDEQLNQSNFTRSTKAEDKKDIDNQKKAEPTIPSSYIPNPLALNLYTLGYDADKKLTKLSPAVKENLKLYLGQYRILTDAVNIKNAYIINISVEFDIVALREFNDREVLLRCVKTIKDYFEIDNWQINQPISIGDLIYEVGLVEGVQTVKDIIVKNLWDENLGYSGNVYDIDEALRNKTLYPSMDPSIFEIRFPSQDIKGQVTAG
jgi:CxxC motif-containing protein